MTNLAIQNQNQKNMTQTKSINNTSMIPTTEEMNQLFAISRALADTPFYQKLGVGGVLAIWLTAKELRLAPMMCLNGGLHNIDGKVQMSAQLMNMMIINAGHEVEVIYLNNKGCHLRFIRNLKNGTKKINEFEFNESDAIKAQVFGVQLPGGAWDVKPKVNWIKYPRAMYFARAMSAGGKMFFPDVLMGVYGIDEIYDLEDRFIESESKYVDTIICDEKLNTKVPDTQPKIENSVKNENPGLIDNQEVIEKFKQKYEIGSGSKHDKYLTELAISCKKNKNEMIFLASVNEKGFVEAFENRERELLEKEKNIAM